MNTFREKKKKLLMKKRILFPPESPPLLFSSQGNKCLSFNIFTNYSPTCKYKLST